MKVKFLKVALTLLLLFLSAQVKAELHYLKTTAGNWQELSDQIGVLEATGAQVRHTFPPNELLIFVHPSIEPVNFNQGFVVVSITEADATVSVPDKHAGSVRLALAHLKSTTCDVDSNAHAPLHLGPVRTTKLEPDSLFEENRSPLISPAEQYNANFMVGRAVVSVIFPESAGNDENWTAEAQQSAFNRVVQGLNWWCDQAEQRNVNVSFVYDMHWEIPVSFEPVKDWAPEFKARGCVPYSRWDWVNEVLNNLGYGGDWEGVFAHCNALRMAYKCNWAFELYVVYAENEPGHVFYGLGAPGYAIRYTRWDYIRCQHYKERPTPMAAVAYSSWWPDEFWRFVAHEVGHVFGGVDEYEDDEGQCNSGKCDDRWGYLQVKNGNCKSCNQQPVPCIMTANNDPQVCDFTAAHLGWRDSDGDGVTDAIDPNNGRWMAIPNVNPGDLVRIYTAANDFVNLIAVTSDNMATQPANYVVWDGNNYDDQACAPGRYKITINNGGSFERLLDFDAPVTPVFAGINYTYTSGNLSWSLSQSFAYVRCFIYDASNNLIARPIWDKLYSANYSQTLNVGFLAPGQTYTAKFFGWCPDGGASQTVNYSFTPCISCGDANSDGGIDISDVVFLIAYIYSGGAAPGYCNYPMGKGDADGSGSVDISDATYLIARIHSGGAAPHCQGL